MPRWLLMLGDLLLVNAGLFLAFYARFGSEFPAENYAPFVRVGPWITVGAAVLFFGLHLYDRTPAPFVGVLQNLIIGLTLLSFVTMALTFWTRGFAFPRSVLVLGAVFQFGLVVAWRVGFWHLEKALHGERPVLIVAGGQGAGRAAAPGASGVAAAGDGNAAAAGAGLRDGEAGEELEIIKKFLSVPRGWFRLHSILPWWDEEAVAAGCREVEAVLLAPSVPMEERVRLASLALSLGREVFLVPHFYDILLLNARVGQVDDLPVLEVSPLGLTPVQQAVKRVLDVLVAAAGIVLLAPLMLLLAGLVRLTSPGPALYRQERVGWGGRTFTLYKFRTMVQDAEAATGPVLAAADDSRVTRVGRWLRATRLDELPQLFNILKGDMSLVGPRPERPHFVARFSDELPDYAHRLLVRPGLTGLAQVMGRYSTNAADKLRYDLYYVRNYSLLLDLQILLHTLGVLFRRDAAGGVRAPGLEEQAAVAELLSAGERLRTGQRLRAGQRSRSG